MAFSQTRSHELHYARKLFSLRLELTTSAPSQQFISAESRASFATGAFGVGDPVVTGLVVNLPRPEGNITGISDVATTLSTKRLGLLKELLPKLHRVAMLWNKDDLGMSLRYDASAKAAAAMGVDVQAVGCA
jgi:putative ABC transport system substrate-binding protein